MKKKILLISSMLVTFILIIFVSLNNTNNENKNVLSNTNKDKQVIKSNMITMMYETEAGSGEYIETKDNTWPESGYIFNETLSGCEKGGELDYNQQNNTVNLLSNSSDRCYVYFDKYDGVWIDNVSITNVTGSSVTLDVSATSENGSISKYYYALNDSEEYIESTTNPIIINDLNKLTEYKISIYAIDSTNAKSNIYELTVNTTDESGPIINSVEVSDITYKGFTLTVNTTNDVEISKYYYVIESDDLSKITSDNSCSFNNLKSGITYEVIILARDINGVLSNEYNVTVSTERGVLLASYLKDIYTVQGANGLYYHDANLENGAADNSYRYAGANPNNYVCFGSDASTCPSDNLYRIIGVFGSEVKLIKNTSIGNNYWSGSSFNSSNTWSNSTLNTGTLNGTYLNGLGSAWSNKIANHDWKVGGMSPSNGYDSNAKIAYNYEVGSNSSSTTYSAKIGLMYVSDYYYGASPTYWTYPGYNSSGNDYRQATSDNWLYLGDYEWTISRDSSVSHTAFYVEYYGDVSVSYHVNAIFNPVRPVFYLSSLVNYVSGTGTQSDPFRIA